MNLTVRKDFKTLQGTLEVPSDKSISHRAVIFTSLACGKSIIKNFSDGQDPHSTLEIFRNLGVDINFNNKNEVIVNSDGNLKPYSSNLDCGNSGTTMRILAGVLASKNFTSTLSGDESLSRRPMKRIIEPLTLMGADIKSNENKAPLTIYGTKLYPIEYNSKISSAQVKSCILMAGINTKGKTTFTEPYISRDHTEIMLKYMGADISVSGNSVSVEKSELSPIEINICGDISSAAYFMTAALIVPSSKIILKNVGLNPTRSGIIDIIKQMGGNLEIINKYNICGETVGDIKVEYTKELYGCNISGEIIPKLIDEIPIISVLATQCEGRTVISDAMDLRNKESDRISSVVTELTKLGAAIKETPGGMIIQGKTELFGDCEVETYHDHRLAMSLFIAGLITKKEISIKEFDWVNISFPTFEQLFENLKK